MANQIRFEVSANNDDLDRLSQQLELLKKQQVELARQAQAGEKTIAEAIKLQSDARKEQLGIEKLLATARRANAEEQKTAINNAITAQNNMVQSYQRELGMLEKLRAELKEQKKAREQATDRVSVDQLTDSIKNTQAEINKLTGATDKFKGSNGFWQDMRRMVVAAFAVDTIIDWTGKMFSASSQIEAFKNSLNRLVGEGQATKIFTDLSKAIVNTPLEFEGATKQIEELIFAYQDAGKSTQNIVKDFLALGNVAKGIPSNVEGITKALADTAAAGKASAQEFNQFSNAGVNLFQLLSESTGKSRKELLQWREDGKISFDLVQQAILKAGSEGGRFFGAMDTQAQTTAGRLSSFKDAVFFALGNVGKQFDSTAKSALSFGTSIINTLFGTEEQAKKTINVITTLVGTFGLYKAAVIANIAIQKAWLVLKGQAILATEAYIGVTIAETEAQIAATTAARSFNATLSANPLGIIALAIGAVVAGYQAYTSSVEESQAAQKKLNTDIANAIAPIMTQKEEFNNLAKSVLNTVLPLNEQEKALERLKIQHPILLKGVQDLTTAEKILNENKIKTNTTLDYRNAKLDELKLKYPEQLKGITTLEEAESKLASVVRITNRDFAILTATMENNIRMQAQLSGANENFAKKLAAQNEIARIKAGGALGISNIFKTEDQIIEAEEAKVKAYDKTAKEFAKAAEVIRAENARLANDIVFKEAKTQNTLTNLAKSGNEKRTKEKIESNETLALIEEKTRIAELQKTEVNEQKLLAIEKDIAIKRINESKASATKKASDILKIEEKFKIDLDKLTDKYDKEEAEDLKKSNEERIKFSEGLSKVLEKIEEEKTKKIIAHFKKLNEDKNKLDEDYKKEHEKNHVEQLKLSDGLRLLDRISHAKNSAEIIEIEKEEKTNILLEEFNYYQKRKFLADIELQKVKLRYDEDSIEYKTALLAKEKADTEFTQVSGELTKELVEKKKASYQKDVENFQKIMSVITQFTDQLFSAIDAQIDGRLSKTTDAVEKNMLETIKKESKIAKDGLSAVVSLASGDIAGGITKGIGAIFESINLAINRTTNYQKAVLEEQQKMIKAIADTALTNVTGIVSQLATVSDVYKGLASTPVVNVKNGAGKYVTDIELSTKALKEQGEALAEYAKNLGQRGFTATELINKEIAYGNAVISNYNNALSKENELYDSAIKSINDKYSLDKSKQDEVFEKAKNKENEYYNEKVNNINKTFDLEIQKITQKYDYESIRANQQYNAQTLAITAAGTAQLEALITNEISLASVRKEFADKRLAIEKAFPLAAIAITEGMSDAEIKSINDSIAARDAALSKLQGWYNTELTTIINAEGQKRKVYTATEVIQNTIQANLDKAALKFQGEEIQRVKDRADAILKAEGDKDLKLQEAKKVHDKALQQIATENTAAMDLLDKNLKDTLLAREVLHNNELKRLAKDKDDAILVSFQRLQAGIEAELNRVSGIMTAINDKTSQEYKDLQTQLDILIGKYKELTGVNPTITVTENGGGTSRGPRGFATGTDRLQNMNGKAGVDSQLIRADVGERIFTKEQNNTLRRVYGRDLGNKEVVKILTQKPKFVSITPTGDIGELVRREAKMSISVQMQGLSREITDMKNTLSKDLNNLPITQTSFDNRGFTRGIKTRTSFTEQKKNKYFNI